MLKLSVLCTSKGCNTSCVAAKTLVWWSWLDGHSLVIMTGGVTVWWSLFSGHSLVVMVGWSWYGDHTVSDVGLKFISMSSAWTHLATCCQHAVRSVTL